MEFINTIVTLVIRYWPSLLLGIQTTLIVALSGTIIGLVIGLFIGGLRAVKVDRTSPIFVKILKKIFQILSSIYIGIFRGTPMMVQAVFIYYALLNVIHWTNLQAAIFVISINTGAYMSEIVRSGIQSVDPGQMEAARSLGLSNGQAMLNVILPQAIRNAFPAIGNEFIVNIKDSSVLMIISDTYFIEALIYLILTTVTSMILNLIEKKLNQTSSSLPQSVTTPEQMQFSGKE